MRAAVLAQVAERQPELDDPRIAELETGLAAVSICFVCIRWLRLLLGRSVFPANAIKAVSIVVLIACG